MYVHGDCLRSVHIAGNEPLELSVRREHLHAVVIVVGDENIGTSVNAHAERLSELALERPVLAKTADEVAVAVKHHHAVCVTVGDVTAAVFVHDDVDRFEKGQRGVRPELAEAAAVLHVVHRYPLGSLVDDDHPRPFEVVRDAHRLAEHLVTKLLTFIVIPMLLPKKD